MAKKATLYNLNNVFISNTTDYPRFECTQDNQFPACFAFAQYFYLARFTGQ